MMKSKLAAACLWGLTLGCSSCLSAEELPLTYELPLSEGLDGALSLAFGQAAAAVAPGGGFELPLDLMARTCLSVRVRDAGFLITLDPGKVRETLSSRGISTWEGLEDPVMLWLCDLNRERQQLVGGGDVTGFVRALAAAAARQRFKLMLPLMDLDDVQTVSADTVLARRDADLARATRRYGSRFFIAGGVDAAGGADDDPVFSAGPVIGSDGGDPAEGAEAGGSGEPPVIYTAKWNVYDDGGRSLGAGESIGDLEAAAGQMAEAVGRVLMENTQNTAASAAPPEDPFALGPGDGFVRILITGAPNLEDYKAIQRLLVTYGYSGDSLIVARSGEGVVVRVATAAAPAILDGTLAHAGDFQKTGDWTYRYNRSHGRLSPARQGIGRAAEARVTSVLRPRAAAAAEER